MDLTRQKDLKKQFKKLYAWLCKDIEACTCVSNTRNPHIRESVWGNLHVYTTVLQERRVYKAQLRKEKKNQGMIQKIRLDAWEGNDSNNTVKASNQ